MVRNNISVLLIVFFMVFPLYGYNSIVTELSIKAGPRGLILIIKTDKPLDDSFQNSVNVKNNQVEIKLFNVKYGLDTYSFSNLTENSPIEKINIKEDKSSLNLNINFIRQINNKTKTKYRENTINYFLSDESYSKIDWTYSETKKNDTKEASALLSNKDDNPKPSRTAAVNRTPNKVYRLDKIDLIQNGNIEKLIINLDSSVQVRTQNRKDALIAVFENAINGFSQNVFTLPENSLFNKVVVKESYANGLNVVGLILYKSIVSMLPTFIHRESSKFSIFTIPNDQKIVNNLSLWSSKDSKNTPDRTDGQQQIAESTSTHSPLRRIVVVNSNAVYRATPSIKEPDNLIDSLLMGDKGTLITHHQGWYFVHFDNRTDTGWVSSTHVNDSADVTKKQWQNIAIYRKKAEKEKQNKLVKSDKLLKKDAFVQSVEAITQLPKIVEESEEQFKKMTRYRLYGRDPFLPLNNHEFVESDLPNIEQCKLVGILFDENMKIALIESAVNGEAFALQENSDILNGRVLKISRKNVTFLLNSSGYSQKYVMNLLSNKPKDKYENKKSEK